MSDLEDRRYITEMARTKAGRVKLFKLFASNYIFNTSGGKGISAEEVMYREGKRSAVLPLFLDLIKEDPKIIKTMFFENTRKS